ncbi:MAG: hypothetical protein ACNA8W_21390 [Bradymonadaceae bacterium]
MTSNTTYWWALILCLIILAACSPPAESDTDETQDRCTFDGQQVVSGTTCPCSDGATGFVYCTSPGGAGACDCPSPLDAVSNSELGDEDVGPEATDAGPSEDLTDTSADTDVGSSEDLTDVDMDVPTLEDISGDGDIRDDAEADAAPDAGGKDADAL